MGRRLGGVVAAMILIGTARALASQPATQPASRPAPLEQTLVTLHLRDVPARTALEELKKQTGMDVVPERDSSWGRRGAQATVTVDADEQPYWVVMRQICAQAGLSVQSFSRKLEIRDGGDPGWTNSPVNLHGAFMTMATGSHYSRQATYAGQRTASENLSINLSVWPEPKVQLIGYGWNAQATEAVDEKGNSLLVPGRGQEPDSMLEHEVSHQYSIPLQPLKDRGQKLARLKGSYRVRVATATQVLEVQDVLNGKSSETPIGEYRFVVKEGKRTGERATVVLEIQRQQGPIGRLLGVGGGSSSRWPSPEGARFVGPNGQNFPTNGWNGSGSGSSMRYEIRLTVGLLEDDESLKLVWTIPTEFKDIDVPFEFTDLPLP